MGFSLIKIFIFVVQESSRCLGFKIYTPYVKRINFFFILCIYKHLAKKKILYINENNNDCHQQKTTCTVLYKHKGKKIRNDHIYIQKLRRFAKIKTMCVTFLFKKIQTLVVTRKFMKCLILVFIYIQKAWHFASRDVFNKKNRTLQKRQYNLRYVLLYTKRLTLFVTQFLWNFWNCRRGGIFANKK